MKFSQTPPELRSEYVNLINRRWRQLYELEKESGQSTLHFLFLVNSGGAAATLAFIGAIGSNFIGMGAKVALGLFVLGIIFCGIQRAKQYHHMSFLFENWKKLVGEYFADNRDWEDINTQDKNVAVQNKWDYIIPYASFTFFILGSLVGFIALI